MASRNVFSLNQEFPIAPLPWIRTPCLLFVSHVCLRPNLTSWSIWVQSDIAYRYIISVEFCNPKGTNKDRKAGRRGVACIISLQSQGLVISFLSKVFFMKAYINICYFVSDFNHNNIKKIQTIQLLHWNTISFIHMKLCVAHSNPVKYMWNYWYCIQTEKF